MICPVCNADNVSELIFASGNWRCNYCGFLFRTNQIPTQWYHDVDYWWKDQEEQLRLGQLSYYVWFKEYILPGKSIEFGAADGDFLNLVHKHDTWYKTTYVEIKDMLRKEYRRNHQIVIDTFENFTEDFTVEGKYQNIFLINTIEHLVDINKVFIKLGALCKDGARVFIITDDGDCVDSANYLLYHVEHNFIFSRKSIEILCEKYGFSLYRYFQSSNEYIAVILEKEGEEENDI